MPQHARAPHDRRTDRLDPADGDTRDASAGWREEYHRQHVLPTGGAEDSHTDYEPVPQTALSTSGGDAT